MNDREVRGACADVKMASSSRLEVRSGVRAGRTWRSGNKVWSDDWLAPR